MTMASILWHVVTEAGKLSEEFDIVSLAVGVAKEATPAGLEPPVR